MVFVKVRETYDLHTVQNKMTVIGIHTPDPDIIKRNYPGLLMQCRSYRPYSCDVRVACASTLPLDPQGVGVADGDVSPEDIFNPILYKSMSNFGMSQLEARINMFYRGSTNGDIQGQSAVADIDGFIDQADDFNLYYGLLSNTHEWRHANPQSGLSMSKLKPLVHEINYAIGDTIPNANGVWTGTPQFSAPDDKGSVQASTVHSIIGGSKPMPFINCTSYSYDTANSAGTYAKPGFVFTSAVDNASVTVPWMKVFVGAVIVPPSRLHQLFYRMVVEWTLEFSSLRPLGEICGLGDLGRLGSTTHYRSYDYESTKEALTGDRETNLDNDSCMVSANVEVNKVM